VCGLKSSPGRSWADKDRRQRWTPDLASRKIHPWTRTSLAGSSHHRSNSRPRRSGRHRRRFRSPTCCGRTSRDCVFAWRVSTECRRTFSCAGCAVKIKVGLTSTAEGAAARMRCTSASDINEYAPRISPERWKDSVGSGQTGDSRQVHHGRRTPCCRTLIGWSWLPAVVYERPKQPVVHVLDAGQLIVA
jgi:hypothetical protein